MPRKSAVKKQPQPARGKKQTIAFGLVNVPVLMKPLITPTKPVSANIICTQHQEKVRMQKVCPCGDHNVDSDETEKGYMTGSGYVVLDDAAVDQLIAEKTGELQIDRVVPVSEIDPLYFGKAYLVYPGEGGNSTLDLFAAALRESGKAAVGNAVLGKQTELVVVRWSEATETLVAHGCHYDSYVKWDDVQLVTDAAASRPAPPPAQVKAALDFLDALAGDFDPEAVEDEYYPALEELIDQAASGKPVVVKSKKAEPVVEAPDLMDALRASVSAAKQGKAPAKKPAGKKVAA